MMQTVNPQSVTGACPEGTISRLFEIGIASCEKREPEKAKKVLYTLIDSLNFDYGEVSSSFLKLYQSTLRLVQDGHYSEAASILQGLRQIWDDAVLSLSQSEGGAT